MQKFDIKYITNLLANYSLDDVEHSMYNLNFEEVYSTGVQLMAVEQLFRELNLRQKQYRNYRLIRLIVILMAAAFDISSIKNIKSSPAIY